MPITMVSIRFKPLVMPINGTNKVTIPIQNRVLILAIMKSYSTKSIPFAPLITSTNSPRTFSGLFVK